MSKNENLLTVLSILFLCVSQTVVLGQDTQLPPPEIKGGMPLMEALSNRKSTRDFARVDIPLQVLSDMLWSAYGFNRPQKGGRTVPSAWNIQNMLIYVATASGLYLYDAEDIELRTILENDIRAATGTQNYVASAPVNLVYVADLAKMSGVGGKGQFYSIAHAGFIAQNVYLFCASAGLGTCVRDLIDREALHGLMQLDENMEIILAQTVGYPAGATAISVPEENHADSEYSLLSQNFPNPFNADTRIVYELENDAHVRMSIYNVQGKVVKRVLDEGQSAGDYVIDWNGLGDSGRRLASGIYFCHIEIVYPRERFEQMRKMIMLE
jgi:SagB-type dehydrogenase family enzyme